MTDRKIFIEVAFQLAKDSNDPSTQTGALIIDESKEHISDKMVGKGFNYHMKQTEENSGRPEKYAYTIHAEQMAIAHSAREGVSIKDMDMYSTWYPCAECAKLIVASGIKRLFYHRPPKEDGWKFDAAKEILESIETHKVPRWGIELTKYDVEVGKRYKINGEYRYVADGDCRYRLGWKYDAPLCQYTTCDECNTKLVSWAKLSKCPKCNEKVYLT